MSKAAMSAAEKRHVAKVVALGCIVCRNLGWGETPCEYHHIREEVGAGQKAGNCLGLGLCPPHHRTGGAGTAFHADRPRWVAMYGSELQLLNQTLAEIA